MRTPKPKPPPLNALAEIVNNPEGDTAREMDARSILIRDHGKGHIGFYVDQTVSRARAGDLEAARIILDDFVGTVTERSEQSWNGPVHFPYASFIADAFQKILDGTEADLALGIKSSAPGRRPSKLTDSQSEALAAGFELLIRNGFTETQTMNAMVAEIKSKSSIQRAKAENPWMKEIDTELLKVYVKPYASQIKRILDAKPKR